MEELQTECWMVKTLSEIYDNPYLSEYSNSPQNIQIAKLESIWKTRHHFQKYPDMWDWFNIIFSVFFIHLPFAF